MKGHRRRRFLRAMSIFVAPAYLAARSSLSKIQVDIMFALAVTMLLSDKVLGSDGWLAAAPDPRPDQLPTPVRYFDLLTHSHCLSTRINRVSPCNSRYAELLSWLPNHLRWHSHEQARRLV